MDWVEYSTPFAELEGCGSLDAESTSSEESGIPSEGPSGPIILVNDRDQDQAQRRVVDPQVLVIPGSNTINRS